MATVTFEIRRPFGGASAGTYSGTLVPHLAGQRIGGNPPPMYYSHILTVGANVDIRDGVSRVSGTNQLAFGNGDEVRTPPGSSPLVRYMVSYVEKVGTYKRVYLTRDQVDWANGGV